jgi:hypothetical protein
MIWIEKRTSSDKGRNMNKRKNIQDFIAMKKAGEKITVLTAYDASIARLLHACDVDILLVGDSLGMVVLGYDSTVPVTMDQMIHHPSAVMLKPAVCYFCRLQTYPAERFHRIYNNFRKLK